MTMAGSATITTTYRYSGGLFDGATKEFRGFHSVKVTDAAGTSTETLFHQQDDALKGRISSFESKGADGKLFSSGVDLWDKSFPAAGVTFPFLAQEDRYISDGAATTSKHTQVQYQYDAYGNLKTVNNLGDLSIAEDDRTDGTDFVYADTSSLYIISTPKRRFTTDSAGNLLSQVWFDYDGQNNGVAPIKGDLTRLTNWLSDTIKPVTTFLYDSYGNQISITDARGNTSKVVLDSLFQTFPVIETNAKGQSVMKSYYGVDLAVAADGPIPGLLASVTDFNSTITAFKYDPLGRVVKEIIPPDTDSTPTVQYAYERNGIPPESTSVKRRDTSPNGGGTFDTITFSDGLGRTIQTKSEAPNSTQQTVVDTVYNNRGKVESVSIPYFVSTSPTYSAPPTQPASPRTVTLYDPVGRVTKITNPDGTYVTSDDFQWAKTLINANGQKRVEIRDAYGRLIQVEEYTGNNGRNPSIPTAAFVLYATTKYQYDLLGNLKKVIDAKGNETIMEYDKLGRKIGIHDPDMGNWAYEYDFLGNLKKQVDAKGQSIYFSYDALNRMISKGFQEDTQSPTVPTNLSASPASPVKINLTWTASTDNTRVQGYTVFRNGASVGTSATTSFQDTGLTPNTPYSYTVSAFDPPGNASSASATASATTLPDTSAPSAPTNLTAAAVGETQISLAWSAATDDVGVAGYKIERSLNNINFSEIGTSSSPAFSSSGLSPSTTYYYKVRAVDLGGNLGDYSNVASAITPDTTPPTIPQGLAATPINETQINLNWNASTDNVGVTGYQIERSSDGGATWPFTEVSPTNSYQSTGLTFTTTYRYRVKAKDAAGNISLATAVVIAKPKDSTPPSVPALTAVTASGSTAISISWSASTDNVQTTGYRINRCSGNGCTPTPFTTTGASPRTYTSTGLSPSTTYNFSVQASDAAGNYSAPSNVLGATTGPDQPPTTPLNLSINFYSHGSTGTGTCLQSNLSQSACVHLSWSASQDDISVSFYEIQKCTGSGCTSFGQLTTRTSTFYDEGSLSSTGSYRYRVRAFDGAGQSSGWICRGTTGGDLC